MSPVMKIAVLMGGQSNEREISLQTGAAVARALEVAGHSVSTLELGDPLEVITREDFLIADVIFPALHGGAGEDGRLQALLEFAGKPYVGSRPGPSAMAMDKVWTKRACRAMDLPTADWLEIPLAADAPELLELGKRLGWPVVLKPVGEGSARGVHILHSAREMEEALEESGNLEGDWFLERYIPGRELTLPILWDEAMENVEIRPKSGFYDYRNKYTSGCSEYHCPADIPTATAERMARLGLELYRSLRLRDMARIDFRMDPQGDLYLLEANTIPGMTELSLQPMAAKARGIDFPQMCERLCRRALERGPDLPGSHQ